MALLNELGALLQQISNGHVPSSPEEAHAHYDQIASGTPHEQLATAIGPAIAGLGGSTLKDRIATSATQMTTDQRGSIVGTLLSGLGGNAAAILSQLGINPSVAAAPAQASPQDVGVLAQHAQQTNPDLFNRAMQVYARHPTLVKALGTIAIAKIAQQLTRQR